MTLPWLAPYETNDRPVPLQKAVRGLFTLAVLVVSLATLYVGKPIWVPLALAALLSFALSPLVGRLTRLSIPHTLAVGIVVCAAITVIVVGFFSWPVK
jgi:predicted PurR-regulated permease PerM